MTDAPFTRFLRSPSAPLAVAAFIGFSIGLLAAALFFPARVEIVEVQAPAVERPRPQQPSEPNSPAVRYVSLAMEMLPGWSTDSVAAALPALRNGCLSLDKKSDTATIGPDGLGGTAMDWRAPCTALARLGPGDDDGLYAVLQEFFSTYAVETPDGPNGTFTGYYETSLRGSFTKSDTYSVPLYSGPRDLVELDNRAFDLPSDVPSIIGRVADRRLIPYDTRRDIERSENFANRAEVLVWVDDPVDAHLLHIQGSGRVQLPDGTERRIGYAGNNGRRFRGIGDILLRAGAISPGQGSMLSVAEWLRQNPAVARRHMEDNPRYIFFRWIEGPGPIGAFGAPLEPGRSLAVDPRYIPYGAPLWLNVKDPDGLPLNRLVVALDTGSAIRGAVRGDFFWGAGEAAFAKAGRMKSTGRYYLLLPRSVSMPMLSEGNSL